MQNNDFKDEKDAFWDIESLIPNRRPQTPPKAPPRSVEATEIVIAAKNPDPEEIIYESADFLYHLMVLMADKGVTWDDILDELSKRESAK